MKRFPGNDRFTDKTADMFKLFESNNSPPVDGVAEALMPALLLSARAEVKLANCPLRRVHSGEGFSFCITVLRDTGPSSVRTIRPYPSRSSVCRSMFSTTTS